MGNLNMYDVNTDITAQEEGEMTFNEMNSSQQISIKKIRLGDEYLYRIRLSNPSVGAASGLDVSNQIPGNTVYVRSSARGFGRSAVVSISVDNGHTFLPEASCS